MSEIKKGRGKLSSKTQALKIITGSWYLKFTPKVPLTAPNAQTPKKTARKYMELSFCRFVIAK
jgi:hypothetical protein